MEMFKKVYIKSEADLPTEDGEYFVFIRNGIGKDIFIWDNAGSDREIWIETFEWYLQPISAVNEPEITLTEEGLDKALDELLIERGEHPSKVRCPLYGEERDLAKRLVKLFAIPTVSDLLCGSFEPDDKTSSATKCKCGREKWEHQKATGKE